MGLATAAIVGGSLLGGHLAGKGAKDAAKTQSRSADAAIAEQQRSKAEAARYYQPYEGVGGLGLDQMSFLTDPNEQYNWLQNNPLFQMSLDNANDVTSKMAAAKGRLSAGDTLMQLQQNGLLASMPLINDQKNSINNLLNFGAGMTNNQANTALGVGNNISNLMTQQGNAQAAGIIGQSNAQQNMLNGMMSGLAYYGSLPSGGGI